MLSKYAILAATAVAALGFAGAASAEAFNGPYVGGEFGWGQDRSRFDMRDSAGNRDLVNPRKSSIYGGGFIGYNAKMGDFVLGGEANIDFGGKTAYFEGLNEDAGESEGGVFSPASVKAKRDIKVVAKIGGLITPKTMLYGKGGWANTRYRADWGDLTTGKSLNGWVLGAGIEQALTQHVTARVEYSYTSFGKGDKLFRNMGVNNTFDNSFSHNQVTVGVAYHF